MEKIIYETIEKEMEELKSRMKKCYYSKSGLNEAEKYMKGLLILILNHMYEIIQSL